MRQPLRSFPLPACGERVASSAAASRVRGSCQFRIPITRTAMRSDLSPLAGRGETGEVGAFTISMRHAEIGVDHRLVALDLLGRSVRDLAAIVKHDDAIGEV